MTTDYWATETCVECKMRFAMPRAFYETMKQLAEKGTFSCPAGHRQHYVRGETEEGRLRRERDRLQQQLAYKDDEIERHKRMREAAERSAAARKGQITKMKKRAAGGVCQCCNRSFENLQRHMKTQHPTYVAEEVA